MVMMMVMVVVIAMVIAMGIEMVMVMEIVMEMVIVMVILMVTIPWAGAVPSMHMTICLVLASRMCTKESPGMFGVLQSVCLSLQSLE